ncbi:MAG: methionyl-tRNA formyltransferase [Candidatus Omnitrophota bacterium]|nr:MAG: methionyl-tRNA formyltransferase [Candidatus Omnitrophota bacterium]
MKFVYFGSSRFSCTVLEYLYLGGFIPTLIISQPDKPKGRGLKVGPTEVSSFAAENDISLIRPRSLKDSAIHEQLQNTQADFLIAADYGKILPVSILSLPQKLPLGLHPSLLPQYRGPAPVNWALLNCEKMTGITVFKINEKVDSGEIILQKKIAIEERDNIFSLTETLAKEGARLLRETIKLVMEGNHTLTPQDESLASFAPKLRKDDGRISWKTDASRIINLIKATLGWPSAYTYLQDKSIKILDADVIDMAADVEPSTIVKIDREGICVVTSRRVLRIKRLKPEGKKDMDAWAFACGHRIKVGDKFS